VADVRRVATEEASPANGAIRDAHTKWQWQLDSVTLKGLSKGVRGEFAPLNDCHPSLMLVTVACHQHQTRPSLILVSVDRACVTCRAHSTRACTPWVMGGTGQARVFDTIGPRARHGVVCGLAWHPSWPRAGERASGVHACGHAGSLPVHRTWLHGTRDLLASKNHAGSPGIIASLPRPLAGGGDVVGDVQQRATHSLGHVPRSESCGRRRAPARLTATEPSGEPRLTL
jgi:hypothetical protein